MSGIADSLIAAILYSAGRKIWTKLNDPIANAIDKTIKYFEREERIVIRREGFAALLEGSIGEEEINNFKVGEKFIDGEKLALQFAKFGDLYFDDESKTLEVASEVFSYFKSALTSELLKDPASSMQTLWSIQNIALNISQEEHQKILDEIQGIAKRLKKAEELKIEKGKKALWPGVSLPPLGGVKVSEPFAGREEELKELCDAMDKDKGVVAVVGMAGQGKSCLAGEWYKRGARPPEGVGLFWRKVYEAGYTFDRFLDDFYTYLTGEEIDRKRFGSVEERAILVEGVFRERPCWIVLDGVERWLKRWASEPDAGAEDLTIDDRAGQEAVLDKLMKDAAWWENGSRLLLTTRAVPSGLDENPPIMIGKKRERERRLEDLRPEEAVELLEKLGVTGDKEIMREAAGAYGNHPYAVHVLGVLIHDLYGGDVSRWEEVSPLEEKKKGLDVGILFEKIIEHRAEDLELLEIVACSVGPAPVEMLAELLVQEDSAVRKTLAQLAKWQMVEFEGKEAEQHTVVRKFMTERIGKEATKGMRLQIALWWAERKVPVRPIKIEEIRPLLKAIEHLLVAREPNAATGIFFTRPYAESYYTVFEWLQAFGYLDEDIRICGEAIRIYVEDIGKENTRELRKDLAMCYNNRGAAYWSQGKLSEAIVDYGKAMEICKELVEKENRREFRNDLAACYNNRGLNLRVQGRLSEAIDDLGKAIGIREELVEKENRSELRNDLASSYNSRGNAYWAQGRISEAIVDYGKAIKIYKELVEKENRLELRNALAGCYNNRGNAYWAQGRLSEAIADFDKAIEIYKELVEKEDRRELRNDLAKCYNNRGNAYSNQGKISEAITDYSKSIEIYKGLVEKENRREFRNDLAAFYNNRGNAYSSQGKPSEAMVDYCKAMEIYKELVEKENRRELRNYLALCYNNRGNAYSDKGKLSEAIVEYGKAIEIYKELVEKEGRRELRNELAGCYNNQGDSYNDQGKLSEAIADYGKAIEIREELVEKQGRLELRSDLESSLFNRAVAQSERKEWRKARADIEKGAGLLRGLIGEGHRHVIESFLQMAGFRCAFAKELGDVREAAEWANEGMRWFLEEAEAERLNEVLLREAAVFAEDVRANVKLLVKNGLDEEVVERFLKAIGGEGRGR